MGPEGVGNKDISTIAGQAAEGLYVTLPPSFDQLPENQGLVDAFKRKGKTQRCLRDDQLLRSASDGGCHEENRWY